MSPDEKTEYMLVLDRCRMDDAGHLFGLRSGDILVGVNGVAWRGTAAALQMHMASAGQASTLTFQRGSTAFSVLVERADLGQWRREPLRAGLAEPFGNPEKLQNWEVMVDGRGNHDLFATAPSILALVAPPVWLAQTRLWAGLAVFAGVSTLALPVGVPLLACVWLVAGLHLWRDGAEHQRVALLMQGYRRAGIIAARNETGAVESWQALVPNARFRFAAPARPIAARSELG